MFPVDYGFSDSFIRIGLRCYSDPNFGNYQSNPSIGCTQLITTSAPENNPLFPQKTYPNPTAGLVKIEFPAEIRQPKTLRIFDTTGRLVQQHQIAAEQKAIQVTLPAKGLYLFLTEIQGQTVFSQKIIRE